MNKLNVSVIIPAYNCEGTILKVIQGIRAQTFGGVEIIIVDDGSTDKTANVVKSVEGISYYYQDNAGPATARNMGAQKARGDILFFTDSDCIPDPHWIESAIIHFDVPGVAVVAGSYGIANKKNMLARIVHKEILFRHAHLMKKFPKVFGSYNFGIKKKVFQDAGEFNTTYCCASGEDNDLSYKILKRGHRIYFEKKALVHHYHPSRIVKYLREQFRHGFWRVKMYRDYPVMAKGDGYTFWKDIIEIPLVLLFMLSLFLAAWIPVNYFPAVFFIPVLSVLLFLLELFFGLLIMKNIFEGIFLSVVMFLRAFSRTAGFLAGIVYFYFLKRTKKS